MIRLWEILILCIEIYLCQSQFILNLESEELDRSLDSGGRLLLSKLIEKGHDNLARKLSKVDEKYFLGVKSYSGYLTVDEEHKSNSFFWFFPAEGTEHLYEENQYYEYDVDSDLQTDRRIKNETLINDDKPVVLWLQGGPGCSSLFGLFTENGPFFVNEDEISIRKNPYSWHTKYNLLFIDNPVGTGFSFTNDDDDFNNGYCRNTTQVAKHLYSGLSQFFHLFPSLATNPFFITGESFAGKYIPAIGYEIYERNKVEDFQINLQGLALGNALSDPYNMLNYGDYAYQTGLVDRQGWRKMKSYEYNAKQHRPNDPATGHFWHEQLRTLLEYSNYTSLYNILEPKKLKMDTYFKFMDLPHIRKAVHVGDQEFAAINSRVYYYLLLDFMTTAMHWTESLLNQGLRIMYYSGNLDLIVAYPLSEEAYERMKWNGSDSYQTASRKPFYFNDTLHGYVKKAKNFYDVLILNAGHMVPTDQPAATLDLLDRFIDNKL